MATYPSRIINKPILWIHPDKTPILQQEYLIEEGLGGIIWDQNGQLKLVKLKTQDTVEANSSEKHQHKIKSI